jgi:hypothetical protein
VPTNRVYIFAEKVPFPGPESPPFGPTEEYYRNHEIRGRLEARILAWCEAYKKVHGDMSVVYEDEDLRVYEIDRKVDVARAERTGDFRDYTWKPGQLFNDDKDITADRVTPDTGAATGEPGVNTP